MTFFIEQTISTGSEYKYYQPAIDEYRLWRSGQPFNDSYDGYDDDKIITFTNLTTPPTIWQDGCPSAIPNNGSADDLIILMSTAANDFTDKQNDYNDFVDGGNTNYILDRIESIVSNNKKQVLRELNNLEAMSEISLDNFVNTNINGQTKLKKSILLSNSPLPENIKPLLADYNLPKPHLQKVIDAQEGFSIVEQNYNELAEIETDYREAVTGLIQFALTSDTISIDSVITLLEQDTSIDTRIQLMSLYLSEGRLNDVLTTIDLVETNLGNIWSQERVQNIEEQLTLIKLNTDIRQPGADRQAIIEGNSIELFDIALRDYTRNSVLASVLLSSAGLIDYVPAVVLPQPYNKSLIIKDDVLEEMPVTQSKEQLFNLYPNPNDGNYQLEYSIENAGQMVIYSISGVELVRYNLNPDNKYYNIKGSKLSPGIYIYRIFENDNVVYTDKYTILKQ